MDFQRIIGEMLGRTGSQTGAPPGSAGGLESPLSGLGGRGAGGAAPGGAGQGGAGFGGLGGSLGDILGRLRPPMGGAAGAAAAGGLLGSLLGGRGGGGLLRTGGMAVIGLLAHRAYETWKTQQSGQPAAPASEEFAQPAAKAGGEQPFGLVLVRAMVAAARADGTLDASERDRIFDEAERLQLDPGEKAEMFRILETSADPQAIARLAVTDAQKAEIYTASALIIGTPGSAERAYLEALAGALDLPNGLRARLDAEVKEALATPPSRGAA